MSQPTLPKPAPCPVQPDNIPAEMKARDQWVCWKWVWKPPTKKCAGKWDKPPFNARTGRLASSTNPKTWSPFDVAYAAYLDPKNGFDGIGYVFSGELGDFTGLDLDDCLESVTGALKVWTADQRANEHWNATAPEPERIASELNSYGETSPSGTGLKLIVCGDIPRAIKHGDVEFYQSGRYFTVTGHLFPACPRSIRQCGEELDQIYRAFDAKTKKNKPGKAAKGLLHQPNCERNGHRVVPNVEQIVAACEKHNGAKFSRLFAGDISGYASPSEADLALCGILAFYSAGNAALIDQTFRQSKLYREKWDEGRGDETYGQRTIRKALEGRTEFFGWGQDGAAPITVGCLTLTVKRVRRTVAKITVQVEVSKDGKPIDLIKLTDSVSSRKEAIKAIAAVIPDVPDAKSQASGALGKILVDAARQPDEVERSDVKKIHEVLAAYVSGEMEFQYATDDGKAFSCNLGRNFSRSQFLEWFTNETTIALCSTGSDAPRDDDGRVVRLRLVGAIKRELEVLWGELFSRLGLAADAVLSAESRPAVEFRQSLITAWTKLVNMGIHKLDPWGKSNSDRHTDRSLQLTIRNSLATRVQKDLVEVATPVGRWAPAQTGFDAYFRVLPGTTGGEFRVLLAVNFKLAAQVGVKFPGAIDQKSLNKIGVKFGAFDPKPPVSLRMTGGLTLSVLSEELVKDILAVPLEDAELSISEGGDGASEDAPQHE